MIQAIEVINSRGDALNLSLSNPVDSGIYIKSVRGLGPVKATVAMSDYCTMDGSRFNMARAETRNIVLSLGFLPNPTIEDTRIKSYTYFPVKDKVMVKIKTDSRTSVTTGYIESNEPDIFSKKEGASVSILCPSSFFHSDEYQYTSFYGSMGLFKFPFENIGTAPNIKFGEFYNRQAAAIVYDGEVDTGITININAYGETGNITIHSITDNEYLVVDSAMIETKTGTKISKGDNIIISTEKGNKSALLARNGVYTNIISCIKRDSKWLQIHRGTNYFAISAAGGQDTARIVISNRILFYGA